MLVVTLLCGCLQTPRLMPTPEPEGDPLTKDEIKTFYEQGKDPRRFWLTVYDSDAGPVFSNDFRTHPHQYCLLPFKSGRDSLLPVIQFQGRGPARFRALIDTSSSEVWASFPAAADMGFSPLNNPPYRLFPVHVDDPIPGFMCAGDRFRLDQLQLETPLVFARAAHGSLGPLQRGAKGADAVFGMRFLKIFQTVQFDFPGRELVLAVDSPHKPDPKRLAATVPYSSHLGALTVKGSVGGQPANLLLDTAGPFGLALAAPPAQPIGEVRLGELVFRDVMAAAAADHGLGMPDSPRVGLDLLARYKVTIDSEKKVIYFEEPPE